MPVSGRELSPQTLLNDKSHKHKRVKEKQNQSFHKIQITFIKRYVVFVKRVQLKIVTVNKLE